MRARAGAWHTAHTAHATHINKNNALEKIDATQDGAQIALDGAHAEITPTSRPRCTPAGRLFCDLKLLHFVRYTARKPRGSVPEKHHW
jgi:hypothetical protein